MTEVTTTIEATSTPPTKQEGAGTNDNDRVGAAMSTANTTDAIGMIRGILGQSIKCTLDDGRTATGTFVCMDRL